MVELTGPVPGSATIQRSAEGAGVKPTSVIEIVLDDRPQSALVNMTLTWERSSEICAAPANWSLVEGVTTRALASHVCDMSAWTTPGGCSHVALGKKKERPYEEGGGVNRCTFPPVKGIFLARATKNLTATNLVPRIPKLPRPLHAKRRGARAKARVDRRVGVEPSH